MKYERCIHQYFRFVHDFRVKLAVCHSLSYGLPLFQRTLIRGIYSRRAQRHALSRISDRAPRRSHPVLRGHLQEILRWGTSRGQALEPQVGHQLNKHWCPNPSADKAADRASADKDEGYKAAAPQATPVAAEAAAEPPTQPAQKAPQATKGRGDRP